MKESLKLCVLGQPQNHFAQLLRQQFSRHFTIVNSPVRADLVYNIGVYRHIFKSHKRPLIIAPTGSDIAVDPDKGTKGWVIKKVLRRADHIHVQDVLSRERCIELGVKPERIKVFPWGVDMTMFKPTYKEKHYDVLNIYGNQPEKYSVPVLKAAIPIINNQMPGLVFKITEGDVPYQDMPSLLNMSTIFVDTFKPTHNHGGHTYGMALHEAMACKTLTIVAERPTVKLDGQYKWYYGLMYDGTPEHLTEKVVTLLNYPVLQKTIIEQNYLSILKNFNLKTNVDKVAEELKCIVV